MIGFSDNEEYRRSEALSIAESGAWRPADGTSVAGEVEIVFPFELEDISEAGTVCLVSGRKRGRCLFQAWTWIFAFQYLSQLSFRVWF
jgi:hypothetical protein